MKNLLLFFLAICLHIILHAQVTNGLVAYYPLNGNENDSSGNGNNGSAGGITSSTDRYGFSNAAAYFDGTAASVAVPRSIEDNFTVSFWFKTTQVTSTGAVQWYQGKGLVDAEICGVTNDWGITLINGGKVCVGIGNPDVTLFSPNDYNDGNWHHVAVRRNMATSFVELFIDSVLVASGNTINTQSLNTASGIRFGNDYCAPFSSLFNGEMVM